MKKEIKQNSDGGTEIYFLDHVITIQPSIGDSPPNGSVGKKSKNPTTIWMKMDRGKWIQSLEPSIMKTVERFLQMRPSEIFNTFYGK